MIQKIIVVRLSYYLLSNHVVGTQSLQPVLLGSLQGVLGRSIGGFGRLRVRLASLLMVMGVVLGHLCEKEKERHGREKGFVG